MTNYAIIQDIDIERGVESVRVFANAMVGRERDVGETLLKGTAWASHIGQLGGLARGGRARRGHASSYSCIFFDGPA